MDFISFFLVVFLLGWIMERRATRQYRSRCPTCRARRWTPQESGGAGVVLRTPLQHPGYGSFGDGAYEVGVDISPGTYQSPGHAQHWTIWTRLGGPDGQVIVAHGASRGPCIVTIGEGDRGFVSQWSGGWTRMDGPIVH